jgi:hypothetical protein
MPEVQESVLEQTEKEKLRAKWRRASERRRKKPGYRAKQRELYRNNGYCKKVRENYWRKHIHTGKDYPKMYENKGRMRGSYYQLRAEAIEAYGKICRCCGEDLREMLSIDHINGDGNKHRRETGTGRSFYLWLKKNNYPQREFQILCLGCNMAKKQNARCPHQLVKTPIDLFLES